MRFADLNYDVLYHIFSFIKGGHYPDGHEDYKRLLRTTSVCSAWRAVVLQFLHQCLYIEHDGEHTISNARLLIDSDKARCAQSLYIYFEDVQIEGTDIVGVFSKAGLTQAIWPQVKRLCIDSYLCDDIHQRANEDTDIVSKHIANLFCKHTPKLADIECHEYTYVPDIYSEQANASWSFLPELIRQYPTQIRKLALSVSGSLASTFSFPQQLVYLDAHMDNNERRVVLAVFAPTLQYLRIADATADITWSWFDSRDSNGDVWFTSLKELVIEFEEHEHRQGYRTGSLPLGLALGFKSDYHEGAKHIHFPALRRLRVKHYPYDDDSFYRLFEKCPLDMVDCESPKGFKHHIPLEMLADLSCLDVSIQYSDAIFEESRDGRSKSELRTEAYEKAVSTLVSSQSAANSARLALFCPETIPLPDALALRSVQRLELSFSTDMASVYTILAQMPKLRCLSFRVDAAYIGSVSGKETRQQPHMDNRSIELLKIGVKGSAGQPKRAASLCLSKLLPLVPSLLKLSINKGLQGVAEETIADPRNSLGWASQQVQIVEF